MSRWCMLLGLTALCCAPCAHAGTRVQDLELAQSGYVEHSVSMSPEVRQRALQFIARVKPRVASMSQEEFLLCMLQLLAIADNAHDVLNDEKGAWYPQSRLPLRMIWFSDGWVIARAAPEYLDLLGARVLRIEGLAPATMLARMRSVWGGPDASLRWNVQWIIENGGLLHALGAAQRADGLQLELQLADGHQVTRYIAFVPNTTMPSSKGPVRLWSADPWPGEADQGWRSAPAGPQPLYLQDSASLFRVVPLPGIEALYVQFRSHLDGPNEKITDLMHTVDAAIEARHPRRLIVDLRFDIGGNTDLTREWTRTIPDRIPDRIYVLVSPYTFSAGIVAAAAFKHDGGAKVRIVGDELGDRLVFWSEGRNVCLPTSHYCLHATTGKWDLVHGCQGQAGCYGDTYQVTVGTLRPDLPAPLDGAAWIAGQDPGMDAVMRDITTAR